MLLAAVLVGVGRAIGETMAVLMATVVLVMLPRAAVCAERITEYESKELVAA